MVPSREFLESAAMCLYEQCEYPATNERVIPSRKALVCNLLEAIEPNNPLCDQTYYEWLYIAERAFEGGEYSYERERAAQHEVFGTREDRLVPMQVSLLLKRRENIPPELEEAMLRHYGGQQLLNQGALPPDSAKRGSNLGELLFDKAFLPR